MHASDMEHESEIQRLPTAMVSGKDKDTAPEERVEMEQDESIAEDGKKRSKLRMVAIVTALFVGAHLFLLHHVRQTQPTLHPV